MDWNRCVPMRRKVPFLPYSINWLRAIIRETEVAAAFAFRKQDGTLERPDILELLDGLSNAVYAFMLLVKAGDRGLGAIQAARG